MRRSLLRSWLALLGLLLAGDSGCQGTQTPIAILPVDAIGARAVPLGPRIQQFLGRELAGRSDLRLVGDATPAAGECEGSTSRERCLAQAARRIGAEQAVAGAVAGLGQTLLLKIRLIDVSQKAVTRTVEAPVSDQDEVEATMRALSTRLLGERPTPRWYRQWWVWTSAAALVAAAIAIPLAVRPSDPYEPLQIP